MKVFIYLLMSEYFTKKEAFVSINSIHDNKYVHKFFSILSFSYYYYHFNVVVVFSSVIVVKFSLNLLQMNEQLNKLNK